jgi:acetoin utilization deacetylase AcuC-like enzyme
MIFVSAGYDGHWADPLGPLALSVAGYTALTHRLVTLAEELCGGRIVLALEGGYNREALGACVVGALRVLLGREPGADPLGPAGGTEPDLSVLIERARRRHPLLQAV